MAKKQDLDSFLTKCNFFGSVPFRKLKRKYKAEGVAIYFEIKNEIHSTNGYYALLDDDFIEELCEDYEIDSIKVNEIIDFFTKRSVFNEIQHPRFGRVITSDETQENFYRVIKERVRKKRAEKDKVSGEQKYPNYRHSVDSLIWNLKDMEYLEFICPIDISGNQTEVPRNLRGDTPEIPGNCRGTSNLSKVKGSEVKGSKECEVSGSEAEERKASTAPLQQPVDNLTAVVENFHECGFTDDILQRSFHKGQLEKMIEDYSADWIIQATKRASCTDKRNIGYITNILKAWKSEGGIDTPYYLQSDSNRSGSPSPSDVDKYIELKYPGYKKGWYQNLSNYLMESIESDEVEQWQNFVIAKLQDLEGNDWKDDKGNEFKPIRK